MTVPEIIDIAKASQFLAANDIARKGVFFGGIDPKLPRKIYMARKNVEYVYDLDSSDSTLPATSSYLLALCGGVYGLRARHMTGGGGSVSPVGPPPSTLPQPYYFIVSPTSFIPGGSGSVVIDDFAGYNVMFVRGVVPQSQVNNGASYFSWNRTTKLFQMFPDAVDGEELIIMPVG